MMYRNTCPHIETPAEFQELFGGPPQGPCRDCTETRSLYDDVYYAMAGNVYARTRLAGAGLIPGSSPTLSDLNRAGVTLHAQLGTAYADALGAELAAY